jgi:hypothetical protein
MIICHTYTENTCGYPKIHFQARRGINGSGTVGFLLDLVKFVTPERRKN